MMCGCWIEWMIGWFSGCVDGWVNEWIIGCSTDWSARLAWIGRMHRVHLVALFIFYLFVQINYKLYFNCFFN